MTELSFFSMMNYCFKVMLNYFRFSGCSWPLNSLSNPKMFCSIITDKNLEVTCLICNHYDHQQGIKPKGYTRGTPSSFGELQVHSNAVMSTSAVNKLSVQPCPATGRHSGSFLDLWVDPQGFESDQCFSVQLVLPWLLTVQRLNFGFTLLTSITFGFVTQCCSF